jgi:hypothetical protein
MLGQSHFEARLGDIFQFSAVPYLAGEGELCHGALSAKVEWEVNVAVTGDIVFALTSDKLITPQQWVNPDGSLSRWALTGRTADGASSVVGEGVTLSGMRSASDRPGITYFGHCGKLKVRHDGSGAPTRLEGMLRNFTFLGLEVTAHGSGSSLDKFHVAVAGREVYFHQHPQDDEVRRLLDTERIDRSVRSVAHVPLLGGEAPEAGLVVLDNLERLVSFLTLNRVNAPVVHLWAGDRPAGLCIMDLPSDPYRRGGVVDNHVISGGIKACVEEVYDRFVTLDAHLSLRRFIDMVLEMQQQRAMEFRLAGLLLCYEQFCTSYLTWQRRTLDPETNIEQKLNMLNSFLRFIPKDLLDPTLRRDIRNPLFHQGLIVGADLPTLWGWYVEYLELLLQIVFVVLGYTGRYISPENHRPANVPATAAVP